MNRVLYQTFALFSWFLVLTFFPTACPGGRG
jgi:hypothetical protein